MASLFNTLCRLFGNPPPRETTGPVTVALRALEAEFGGRA